MSSADPPPSTLKSGLKNRIFFRKIPKKQPLKFFQRNKSQKCTEVVCVDKKIGDRIGGHFGFFQAEKHEKSMFFGHAPLVKVKTLKYPSDHIVQNFIAHPNHHRTGGPT
jgi:hypothetical protein